MRSGCLLALWLALCFPGLARAAEPAKYDLDLNRPAPKAGEMTERIIRVISTSSNTNLTEGRENITNRFHSFELQGREKILLWDAGNDLAKADLTVMRLVDNSDGQTNELVKPGTRLTATSIAGEMFFHAENGDLPMPAAEQLRQCYSIRPADFNEFARTRIPRQISVGATWEIPAPTNITALVSFFGASLTNATKVTGRLVGVTNLFGFDCFHLRYQAVATDLPAGLKNLMLHGMPVSIKSRVNLTVDLIVPFDVSKYPLVTSYALDLAMSGNIVEGGRETLSTQGQTRLEVISEFRPISSP